ncbi:cytochrome c biogenesis protein ResC [Insulibacter thermoxylanivorax]|uniref:Cytochrome c biogenesis protein ResC n=2 Tax=Insulibacter thermoxylanivorax TaxID=2749268 RepID=A0A916QD79_9BACL|nr:cytochrome c biogenesis protein ResC [Insulibacter thermoxylanivorax]
MNIEQTEALIGLSSRFLMAAFILYNLAFIVFGISVLGKRWSNREPKEHERHWGNIGLGIALLGFLTQAAFTGLRWAASGHIPVANLYEFLTFFGMMIVLAFILIYLIYRKPLTGLFAMPLAVVIIAYGAVFPSEVKPLIPQLQSIWLYVHVTLAALGEAFLAVGFAAGLMYLLRTVNFQDPSKSGRRKILGVELTLFTLLTLISFIVLVFAFRGAGYHAEFLQTTVETDSLGQEFEVENVVEYTLPPLIKPHHSEIIEMQPFLGIQQPWFEAPGWMQGVNAGRKLNTIVWSLLAGTILYALIRLIIRRPLGVAVSPIMNGIDEHDLDEISYRAIAIGYPIFTLGALIFASIWAHQAWGRFWAFDPKETWALITWLFYTAYLHLRLSRGWQGEKSAWMSVIGFLIIMFTLIGVNLVIAGLHSYAGV